VAVLVVVLVAMLVEVKVAAQELWVKVTMVVLA
jgi:hypothetical protein